MRQLWCAAPLVLALALSATAHAQFANRSIWFSVGFMDLGDNAELRLDYAYPIGVGSSLYIEGGFEATADFQLMIVTLLGGLQTVAIAPAVGIRYLFSEEMIRPYAEVDISYLHVFSQPDAINFVGLGPKLGIDFFLSDSVSLGVRGQYNLYVMLNRPLQTSLGIAAVGAAYF
jgi:outer membrane protein